MNKKYLLIPLLIALSLGGCKNHKSKGGEVMINDFETFEQLSLMKFPFPKHADRGRIDLVNEHATHGERAMRYSNDYGTSLEMCHYFDHIVDESVDIRNIKSIDLDIFNASAFDTSCTFIIYSGKEMNTLLSQDFELKKDQMTHVSFALSKVALEFNYESIICSSLRLYAPETNYNLGIGYTFYIDNWHAVMGSEYTQEDNQYRKTVEEVKDRIDALPEANSISSSDGNELEGIANLIDGLPDLYRSVIPNMKNYQEAVDSYYSKVAAQETINYDKNTYLGLDKFYGIAQLQPDNGVKADVLYTKESWEGNEFEGSTKIIFRGSSDNRFIYKSNIDLEDFDFVHFTIRNATNHVIRMWFSYVSGVSLQFAPGETVTATFPAKAIAEQPFWSIDHIRSQSDGAILAGSGEMYFSNVYVTGRSEKTLQEHMQYVFGRLPSVESLTDEESILNALTSIKTARYLYDRVEDQNTVTSEQVALLRALEVKVGTDGYGVAYNAYDGAMTRFSSYGVDFAAKVAQKDERFGYVSVANIVTNPVHPTITGRHEQAFTFTSDTDTRGNYQRYVLYIYNPTIFNLHLLVRCTNWEWDLYSQYFTDVEINRGWNKIDIHPELFMVSDDHKVSIYVDDYSRDCDMTGEWMFSSLFGVPGGF